MLTKPDYFIQHNISKKKLSYKWNDDVIMKVGTISNKPIYHYLFKLNMKALIGLSAACSEWILWRLQNHLPEPTVINQSNSIQALWLSLIDKTYLSSQKLTDGLNLDDMIEGPINLMDFDLFSIRKIYLQNDDYLCGTTLELLDIARHVVQNNSLFEEWVKCCLKKSLELFPADIIDENDKIIEGYDPAQEPFIPREFYFDPQFDYKTADLVQMQKELLASADYKNNIYLAAPELMLENGFVGTPYQL